MLTVPFNPRYDTVPFFGGWQYDWGQKICITGITIDLPSAPIVHFSDGAKAYKRTGTFADGTLLCDIPVDIMRCEYWWCHIFYVDAVSGTTRFTVAVHLRPRAEALEEAPEDTVPVNNAPSADEINTHGNILTVPYDANNDVVQFYSAWQHDWGQILNITNVTLDLPAVVEVHFTDETHAYKQYATFVDGVVACAVPNTIMHSADWTAHLVVVEAHSSTTKFTIEAHLKSRVEANEEIPTEQETLLEQIIADYNAIIASGMKGPADKYFEFYQAIPSDNIVVTHNLDKYPSVTVIDSAGTQLMVEVQHISKNQALILPKGKMSCKIYFN